MDLTEPQAGSDLGGITTRATELPDGRVTRRRPEDLHHQRRRRGASRARARRATTSTSSKGTTNGLSLVLVARHREDGARNGVRVARLERKLGIHGSPTCEVVFEGAIGVRLGKKGQGFRAMLELMNNARLGVAAQAPRPRRGRLPRRQRATPASASSSASRSRSSRWWSRCSPRWRSTSRRCARCSTAPTRCSTGTSRARAALPARRSRRPSEAAHARRARARPIARARLLTPLCKYFATEVCHDITRDAMQVFGGIGYTMDADVAKLHADSLIMTVYEGTSEIQASFALEEMGKGAPRRRVRAAWDELGAIGGDAKRADLAKRVGDDARPHRGVREGALLRPALRAAALEAARRDGDRREVASPSCCARPAPTRRASTWPRPSSAAA